MNSLWFILVVAGLSFVQWLFKHLAAQAEKRRLQQAQQRAELEMLRTGKNIESSDEAEPRPGRARDNEERRREELAELRRRATARRTPQTQAQPPQQTKVQGQVESQSQTPKPSRSPAPNPLEILLGLPPGTMTGGTVSPAPARTPRPRPQRNDAESKKRRIEQQRLRAQQLAAEAKRNQQRLEQQARAARAASAAALEQRLLNEAKAASSLQSARASIGIAPRSAAEWRRAIVMNEILSKPVSLR